MTDATDLRRRLVDEAHRLAPQTTPDFSLLEQRDARARTRRRRVQAAFLSGATVVLLVAVLWHQGSTSVPVPGGGGTGPTVTGVLEQVGGPYGSAPPTPVAGFVRFGPDAGQPVTVPTRADGTFTAELAPGRYTVTGTAGSDASVPYGCEALEPVVVASAPVNQVVVACHIR